MKKTLLVALLLVNSAFAQQLTGIMGIPFGTSKSQIKSYFNSKQPQNKIYSDNNRDITFTNVKFGTRETEGIIFGLNDSSKYHTAVVLIKPSSESDIYDLYDKIVEEINAKYHYRDSQTEFWRYPYDSDDKYTYGITAIKMDKGVFQTAWLFPVENSENDIISVEITTAVWVKITYQNGNMIKEVVAKNNAKNSADY